MIKERYGDFIKTYTGKMFYPLDPRIEEIDIIDIAHALSNICRFTGHCNEYFSVAQHSVLVSQYAKSLVEKQQALLHDASEAYLSDISSPLKRCFEFFEYRKAEERLQSIIFLKFNLPEKILSSIEEIDMKLLYTEGRDLMNGTADWNNSNNVLPYFEKIIPVSQNIAKEMFLDNFKKLFIN